MPVYRSAVRESPLRPSVAVFSRVSAGQRAGTAASLRHVRARGPNLRGARFLVDHRRQRVPHRSVRRCVLPELVENRLGDLAVLRHPERLRDRLPGGGLVGSLRAERVDGVARRLASSSAARGGLRGGRLRAAARPPRRRRPGPVRRQARTRAGPPAPRPRATSPPAATRRPARRTGARPARGACRPEPCPRSRLTRSVSSLGRIAGTCHRLGPWIVEDRLEPSPDHLEVTRPAQRRRVPAQLVPQRASGRCPQAACTS
jgi:hypothetical protein